MNESLRNEILDWIKDIVIAAVVIAVIMGSLYAYTGTWPPMVVVESESMQHSDDTSYIGVIDTGDIVLSKHVSSMSDITTYVQGRVNGYRTYGDYGDVIIYERYGKQETPIIHRAVLYLRWNQTGSFNVLELKNLTYGIDYTTDSGTWHGIRSEIDIYHYGYEDKTMMIYVSGLLKYHHSGYITAGDHNIARNSRSVDQNSDICPEPVKFNWIVGKAEGELPWFGIIKLMFSGTLSAHPAPMNSWIMLTLSIAALIVIPWVFDMVWERYKGRKENENEGEETFDSDTEERESEEHKENVTQDYSANDGIEQEEQNEDIPEF